MELIEISDELFKPARANMIAFTEYIYKVSQQIGMKEAFSLLRETFESMAVYQALRLKNQSGLDYIDAGNAYSLIRVIPEGLGIDYEVIERSPFKVVIRMNRNPLYDAAKIAGLDPEKFHRDSAIAYMDKIVQLLNPELRYELLKFKFSEDDYFEEQIILR
jgi:hypothetical protein